MAFFKFRLPGQGVANETGAAHAPTESVAALRARARHRLIGAVVLVALAVVCFPLLFDAEPRPIATDVPITIPDRNQAPPLTAAERRVQAVDSLADNEEVIADNAVAAPLGGAARMAAAGTPVASEAAAARTGPEPSSPSAAEEQARKAAEAKAKREQEARAKAEADAKAKRERDAKAKEKREQDAKAKAKAEADAKAKEKREQDAEAKAEADAKAKEKREQDAKAKAEADTKAKEKREQDAKAKAEADSKSKALADAQAKAKAGEAAKGSFVVQVGSFAQASSVKNARDKAAKAGVSVYTREIPVANGKPVTRVRAGPFKSRAEAERAAARLREAGLTATIIQV